VTCSYKLSSAIVPKALHLVGPASTARSAVVGKAADLHSELRITMLSYDRHLIGIEATDRF
jgi:hypothetical protein